MKSDSLEKLVDYLTNDHNYEHMSRDEYLQDVKPIEEWINDPFYTGPLTIYPYWKNKIIEYFSSNKREFIISGGTRSGKSYASNICIMYLLYMLAIYKHKYGSASIRFGLDPSSTLIITLMGITIEKVKATTFNQLKNMIDSSEFFKKYFPRNPYKDSSLEFDSGKVVVSIATSADSRSILSQNMFGFFLDESNFIHRSASKNLRVAMDLFSESRNRIKQTFTINGKTYGMSALISSSDTHSSFIETRIREQRSDDETLIAIARKFEVKPEDFSNKFFYTFIGSKSLEPFVIDMENKLKYKDILESFHIPDTEVYLSYTDISNVEVPKSIENMFARAPIDFIKNARTDANHFLKEVCGISIGETGNFFSSIKLFEECIDSNLYHPFLKNEIEVSTASKGKYNELIKSLKPDFFGKDYNYTLTLDLSKNHDSTGISLGYYDKVKKLFYVVLMIKILPPSDKNHKIRYDSILEFFMYLKNERRFNITKFYCDGYQSEYFIQYLTERNIASRQLGIDLNDKAYVQVRSKILENEVRYYFYENFRKELFTLVHDHANKKINHQDDGEKDTADSVCRLIYSLILDYAIQEKNISEALEAVLNTRNEPRENITQKEMLNLEKSLYERKSLEDLYRREKDKKFFDILCK